MKTLPVLLCAILLAACATTRDPNVGTVSSVPASAVQPLDADRTVVALR